MIWQSTFLGELGEFRNGLNYSKENEGRGLKVIAVKDFGDLRIPEIENLGEINPNGVNTKGNLLQRNDIVFVRSNGNKDLIGRSLFIEEAPANLSFSGFCIRMRPHGDRAIPKFLAYFFRSPLFRKRLSNLGGGANIQNLNQRVMRAMEISLPPLRQQDEIVRIVASYDDLIENNQRRIVLLEEAARQLFKEWFVRFRFPGHEHVKIVDGVPEGWKYKRLVDIADLTMGQSPKSEFYNTDRDGLPFHQGVTKFGYRFVEHETYCTKPTRLSAADDILFSVRAPVGRLNITLDPIILGRGLAAIRAKSGHQSFLFYQLKSYFFKEDMIGGGAIYAAITKKDLENQELLCPSDNLLNQFNEFASALDQQIKTLHHSNQNLTQARDLLLPKLMNGEIAV